MSADLRPEVNEVSELRSGGSIESQQLWVLLFMREPAVVDRLQRSLLGYPIGCAPCSGRHDLVTTRRAVAFSAAILDLDDA